MDKFTWLYIGSQDLWAVFAIILYFSKYADLKLGKPGDKPEYNDVTWFVMLFACGIGVGLFFYGVAEPIFHYTGKNRYYTYFFKVHLGTHLFCLGTLLILQHQITL